VNPESFPNTLAQQQRGNRRSRSEEICKGRKTHVHRDTGLTHEGRRGKLKKGSGGEKEGAGEQEQRGKTPIPLGAAE
jgi:hypothetical protein